MPANQRVIMDQVIAGQYPIALIMFQHHAVISQQKGAPIKFLLTDPIISTTQNIALLTHAPHPNAGKLLIEFILSDEGAKIISDAKIKTE